MVTFTVKSRVTSSKWLKSFCFRLCAVFLKLNRDLIELPRREDMPATQTRCNGIAPQNPDKRARPKFRAEFIQKTKASYISKALLRSRLLASDGARG